MKLTTLSDLFDTKLNSFEAGLSRDEYEKSLYLTQAQDIYYDTILDNFEAINTVSEKSDRLLFTETILLSTPVVVDKYGGINFILTHFSRKILREEILLNTTSENVLYRGIYLQVNEERLAEIQNSLSNPFRKPDREYALRAIDTPIKDGTYGKNRVSLYVPSDSIIKSYTVTYAKEPKPIILETLPIGLSIRNLNTGTVEADLEFKDKDLEKIADIAVSLVLKDAGIYAQQPKQVQQ